MRIEDARIGQRVRVTIDPTRYTASDYAYLTRADGRNPEPSVEQEPLTVLDLLRVKLPVEHTMVVLLDAKGRKAYLAEAHEIEEV